VVYLSSSLVANLQHVPRAEWEKEAPWGYSGKPTGWEQEQKPAVDQINEIILISKIVKIEMWNQQIVIIIHNNNVVLRGSKYT